ncbi:MAG: AsmA family protein [Candidatus Omnitrophica bacterium]|nr:AsmA family protein [Candidatus Omnitrophota bacterium]
MKIIKILISVVVIIVVLMSLTLFILWKTVDINQYKDQLTNLIGDRIGREVNVKKVGFNFSASQGITVDLKGFSIKDDPSFSAEEFFYVEEVRLALDVVTLLTKGRIVISKIETHSPVVKIILNEQGESNVPTAGEAPKKDGGEEKVESVEKSVKLNTKSKSAHFPQLLIQSIRMTDGKIQLINKDEQMPMNITIDQILLNVDEFSLDSPFQFDLTSRLWNEKKNIFLNGQAQIDEKQLQVRLDDVQLKTELAGFSIDKMVESLPVLKQAAMESMEGHIAAKVEQMVVGKKGLLVLSGVADLDDGRMKTAMLEYPIENIDMHLEFSEADINLKELFLYIASGKVNIQGRINDYLTAQDFSGKVHIEDIDLQEIVAPYKLPISLEGKIYGQVDLQGKGFSPEAIKTSLTGEGRLDINQSKVLDHNVLKIVIQRIMEIPEFVFQSFLDTNKQIRIPFTKYDGPLNKVRIYPNLGNMTKNVIRTRGKEELTKVLYKAFDIDQSQQEVSTVSKDQLKMEFLNKYKEKMEQKDTVFDKVEAAFIIRNGKIFINSAQAGTEEFFVSTKGTLSFEQLLTLETDLYFSKQLSEDLLRAEKTQQSSVPVETPEINDAPQEVKPEEILINNIGNILDSILK